MRIDEAFRPLLRGFDLEALDADPATILGVWSDLRLGFTNRAWQRFAEENGAPELVERWPIGASIANAISGPLAAWFRELVGGARTLHPQGLVYPCPSPTVDRTFRLTAYALDGQGLLLVHSNLGESTLPTGKPGEHRVGGYVNADGFAVQCSHCRRFRAAAPPARWDWIPEWVEEPPRATSHGLCPACVAVYYPDELS